MALTNSSRRFLSSAIQQTSRPTVLIPILYPSLIHRRTFLDRIFGRKKDPKFIDPLSPDFLKRKPQAAIPPPEQGDLAPSSIFDEATRKPTDPAPTSRSPSDKPARNLTAMAAVLDPQPHVRRRWERKMIIREIRGRHRMSKTVKIARTERVSLSKSPMFKTSVKKLGPLARQIAGKPIDEAILQMRFSKKKAAIDVKKHLEYARDNAIVTRGMGLGEVKVAEEGKEDEVVDNEKERKALVVEDKDGKRRIVTDRTSIYIDQAWVGRGSFTKSPEYRARGRVNMLMHPTTSISVVLKEEKTRIRLAEEREQKRQRKRVWVPLPDRPVTAQRQYCLW